MHYREDWRDLNGYFAQLERQGSALNIAMFVGATQVRSRSSAMRIATRPRRSSRHDGDRRHADEQGALGVWTALEYAPRAIPRPTN